jgi:hypothetical protein
MKKAGWVDFVWDLAGDELSAITTPRQYRLSLSKPQNASNCKV